MPSESFRELLSTSVIKTLYVLGTVLLTCAGLALAGWGIFLLVEPESAPLYSPLAVQFIIVGFCLLIFGNLFWRLLCEAWIIVFVIHEMIASIEKTSTREVQLLEHLSEQLVIIDSNNQTRHRDMINALSRIT